MSGEDRVPFEDELSAYLDGELDAEREAGLRAALEHDPRLAARLEALRAVDAGLRALPARPVPGDLRARLQARIEASASGGVTRGRARGGAPLRRRGWRAAPAVAAAALAAAVALVMLVRRPLEELPPERVAREAAPGVPGEGSPRSSREPTPGVPGEPAPAPPVEIAGPRPEPGPDEIAVASDLAAASDEELEIAMDWRLVEEDLAMIEELELLEAMLARERGQG